MRRTSLLTMFFAAFLVGVVFAHLGLRCSFMLFLVCAIVGIGLMRRHELIRLVIVIIIGVLFGVWRGGLFMERLDAYDHMYGSKVTLRVTSEEDAVYDHGSQLSFAVSRVEALDPTYGHLPGKLSISGFGENMIYRGDVVEVSGKLRQTRGGKQGYMSYAQIRLIERSESGVNEFRRRFMAGMLSALPEPMASFGAGLLIGQRSTLPDNVSDELSAVGLTHIVAVSGYNLTIIVEAVRRLTKRGSKFQGLLISVTLVGLFLLVTGFCPPIVRAAVVSALGLWAWYFGRTWKPWLLIATTAAITVFWNPLYIWGDISWYLSFLSFFGVLILAPALVRRIYKQREPKFLLAIVFETMSAQILTLPLVLYVFQRISFVSILSNILVVPLVPFAMILALVAGLAGMFIPAVAGWFAWPAKLLLTYMLDVARVLARIPHVVGTYVLSGQGLVWLYGIELFVVGLLWNKTKPKYGIVTDDDTQL